MKLSLLVLTSGKQEGKKLEIKVSPFLIGRDAQCHLRPASPLISKKHCAFILRDGKVFLQDFDSTNGSIVNGQPVQVEIELKDKDRIKIGPLEFQVLIEIPVPQKPVQKPVEKTAQPARKAESTVKKPTPAVTGAQASGATDAVSQETVHEEQATTRPESANSGEDDIAAMLLALGDDTDTEAAALTSEAIPDGSTVMELKVPAELEAADKDKHQKAKESQANTSQAARDILSKYMRRPRG